MYYRVHDGVQYTQLFRRDVCKRKLIMTWDRLADFYNSQSLTTVKGGPFTSNVLQGITRRSVTRCTLK